MPLGTREVDAYAPPDWTYSKILVVEKEGRAAALQAVQLAERYDMAIIANEGFGAVACRTLLVKIRKLLAGAHGQVVKVYSMHDADPYGYNIHATLGEPTVRMPGHRLEVIDLGLAVADAIRLDGTEMGGAEQDLEPEEFDRKDALAARILPD